MLIVCTLASYYTLERVRVWYPCYYTRPRSNVNNKDTILWLNGGITCLSSTKLVCLYQMFVKRKVLLLIVVNRLTTGCNLFQLITNYFSISLAWKINCCHIAQNSDDGVAKTFVNRLFQGFGKENFSKFTCSTYS